MTYIFAGCAMVDTGMYVPPSENAPQEKYHPLPTILKKDTHTLRFFGFTHSVGMALKAVYDESVRNEENSFFCLYGNIQTLPRKHQSFAGTAHVTVRRIMPVLSEERIVCEKGSHYLGAGRTEIRAEYREKHNTMPHAERVLFWKRSEDSVALVIYGYRFADPEMFSGKDVSEDQVLQIDNYWQFKDGRGLRWWWSDTQGKLQHTHDEEHHVLPTIAVSDTSSIVDVRITDAAALRMADLYAHGVKADQEEAFCLYGTIEDISIVKDTSPLRRHKAHGAPLRVVISRVTPASVRARSKHTILYAENFCDFSSGYLGRGHTHTAIVPRFGTPMPYLSNRDVWSFAKRKKDILTLVVWNMRKEEKDKENVRVILYLHYLLKHGAEKQIIWRR